MYSVSLRLAAGGAILIDDIRRGVGARFPPIDRDDARFDPIDPSNWPDVSIANQP
jgi:hypothetical protein